MKKGQILDCILMVEPRGFADSVGGMREIKEARMMPQFLTWALQKALLQFNFHIYDSWIISSYHLYLNGLDKYHLLSKQGWEQAGSIWMCPDAEPPGFSINWSAVPSHLMLSWPFVRKSRARSLKIWLTNPHCFKMQTPGSNCGNLSTSGGEQLLR